MLKDLPNVDEETVLQYAAFVRNCCLYVLGFTAAQLAIGQNQKLDEDTVLQYAASVRSYGLYVLEFTPAQLAIGQNQKLSSIFYDSLSALEGCTTSSIAAQSLNAILAAFSKYLFMQKPVQKSVRHPVRQYFDFVFKPKDNVFYKLPTDRRWQGPVYQGYCY